jgi:very-short-patch-repair endonuclease
MEVDLLSAESQTAIELDGGQHLAVAEAYRRDRRKDVLLQAAPGALGENGYHVLRFLCEDVGKRLDEVLDAIVPALSHRCTRRITEKGRS